MDDKALRQTIGSRTRARRKQLKLTQDYLAEKLDVNKSTIQRYEKGTIDNTKKLIVEGLASALHVSPEYLRGETDNYESTISDKRMLEILDAMEMIKDTVPLGISVQDNEFAENMLLLILKEYLAFTDSFSTACHWYTEKSNFNDKLAETTGYSDGSEYNQIRFVTEIMHTVNTFYDLSDILRSYPRNPEKANQRVVNLLDFV